MKRIHTIALASLVAVCALALVGCESDRTRISAILDNTDRYMGKEVSIAGNITQSYQVNLIIAEAGAYQVDDGTGKIWVITKNGVPSEGHQVGVKGTVSSGIKIGPESVGVLIRETDRGGEVDRPGRYRVSGISETTTHRAVTDQPYSHRG